MSRASASDATPSPIKVRHRGPRLLRSDLRLCAVRRHDEVLKLTALALSAGILLLAAVEEMLREEPGAAETAGSRTLLHRRLFLFTPRGSSTANGTANSTTYGPGPTTHNRNLKP